MPDYEYDIKVRTLPVDYSGEIFIYDTAVLLYYPDPPSDQPEYPDYFDDTCKSLAKIFSLIKDVCSNNCFRDLWP